MANDWATADTFDAIRLNQKTRFIGTGLQATTFIESPQVGQTVFSTLTDTTATTDETQQYKFRTNKFSYYTSAGWVHKTPHETQYSSGNSVSTQNHFGGTRIKSYIFHTLPSTEKFYRIYAIEAGHNATVGNVILGAELFAANPGTISGGPIVAICPSTAMGTGFGNISKVSTTMSNPIKAGSHIGIWAWPEGTNAGYGGISGYDTTYVLDISAPYSTVGIPKQYIHNASMVQSGAIPALKVYYMGYS